MVDKNTGGGKQIWHREELVQLKGKVPTFTHAAPHLLHARPGWVSTELPSLSSPAHALALLMGPQLVTSLKYWPAFVARMASSPDPSEGADISRASLGSQRWPVTLRKGLRRSSLLAAALHPRQGTARTGDGVYLWFVGSGRAATAKVVKRTRRVGLCLGLMP